MKTYLLLVSFFTFFNCIAQKKPIVSWTSDIQMEKGETFPRLLYADENKVYKLSKGFKKDIKNLHIVDNVVPVISMFDYALKEVKREYYDRNYKQMLIIMVFTTLIIHS